MSPLSMIQVKVTLIQKHSAQAAWLLVFLLIVGLLIGGGLILRILLVGCSSFLGVFVLGVGLLVCRGFVLRILILGTGLFVGRSLIVLSIGILAGSGLLVGVGVFGIGIFSIGIFRVGILSFGIVSGSSFIIGSSLVIGSSSGVSTSSGLFGLIEDSGSLVGQSIVLGDLGGIGVVGGRVELDVGGSGTGLGSIIGDVLVQLGLLLFNLGGDIFALCVLDGQLHHGGRELEDLVLDFTASKGKCFLAGLGGGYLGVKARDLCYKISVRDAHFGCC